MKIIANLIKLLEGMGLCQRDIVIAQLQNIILELEHEGGLKNG